MGIPTESRIPRRSRHGGSTLAAAVTAIAATLAVAATLLAAGPAAAAPTAPALGGGSPIIVGRDAACTLTTIGHDEAGRLVGITAGHCGTPGDGIIPENDVDAGRVGTLVAVYPTADIGVIEFDPARVTPVNRVGNVTITDIGGPTGFPDVICKAGRTTGVTCGITWLTDFAHHETWTQVCVMQGDSGAPVFQGTTLVGMISAYLEIPCLGPSVGTTMTEIVHALDAHGGVGAAFRPI